MTKVVNLRAEAYDIYCGRPRAGQDWMFGNPFMVGRDAQRGECVGLFEEWLRTGETHGCVDATEERRNWMLENIGQLKGKRLGCFCKPRACHADVLAKLADEL